MPLSRPIFVSRAEHLDCNIIRGNERDAHDERIRIYTGLVPFIAAETVAKGNREYSRRVRGNFDFPAGRATGTKRFTVARDIFFFRPSGKHRAT